MRGLTARMMSMGLGDGLHCKVDLMLPIPFAGWRTCTAALPALRSHTALCSALPLD